jgi:hypothetical protein
MFSRETYYRLFERYNQALWPWQLALLALGLVVVAMAGRRDPNRRLGTVAGLVLCWVLVAWLFQWERFREIHLAAGWFAGAFLLEGVFLLIWGVGRAHRPPGDERLDSVGVATMLFGMLVQPIIGPLLGRPWHSLEWFGMTPDPTITATLGFLVAARGGWLLWCIPVLYALVSGATLWTMKSPDAWVPPLVVLICIARALTVRNLITPSS